MKHVWRPHTGPSGHLSQVQRLLTQLQLFFPISYKLRLRRHIWAGRSFTAWPTVRLTIRDPTWRFPRSDVGIAHTAGTDVAKHTHARTHTRARAHMQSREVKTRFASVFYCFSLTGLHGKTSFKAVNWSSVFENSRGLIKMIKEWWRVQQRL